MTTTQNYGLTLNQRLSQAGFTAAFSDALKVRNVDKMKSLLKSIEYSEESAAAIIKTFLDSPETFQA